MLKAGLVWWLPGARVVMVKLELPLKMLDFTIEVIEYRMAAYEQAIAKEGATDDDVADMSNDTMVLRCAVAYLKAESKKCREATRAVQPSRAMKSCA
jgi:hypothetical protein